MANGKLDNAKIFNKNTYDKYDQYAKEIIMSFLKKRGHTIIKQEEDYSHDIVTEKNGETFFFEVEVKIGYPFTNKDDYKFSTVSFLGRKKRLHLINKFFYLILCKETNSVVGCDSEIIFTKENIEKVLVNTKDRYGNDEMYRVPKEKCFFFETN